MLKIKPNKYEVTAPAGTVPHRERLLRVFENRIYEMQFCDLSGWDRPQFVNVFGSIRTTFSDEELTRYHYDREQPNTTLDEAKEAISRHLTLREGREVSCDEFIMVPGATAAISVALHFFRNRGIPIVMTDPPYYYTLHKLCSSLGLQFLTIPRTPENLDDVGELFQGVYDYHTTLKALVLTQPRYVLSRNYSIETLAHAQALLGDSDFLLLDQSTDLELTRRDTFPDRGNVLKIRSVGKALSLNGARLAVLMAPRKCIPELNATAGYLFGSLDVAMLKLGTTLISNPSRVSAQLDAVRTVVNQAFRFAYPFFDRLGFQARKPENGYLGYVLINTEKIPRFTLYQHFLKAGVLALFSEQFGLRRSARREMLRVNYLLDLTRALTVLSAFSPLRDPRSEAPFASGER